MADRHLFELLEERGYVYQATNPAAIKNLLNGEQPVTFYLGIDPTADSLHIGHFFALMMFRYLQDAGHRGLLLIGGGTALVGDPSGKSDMRRMMSREQVNHNLEEVKTLARRFIRTDGDNPALIVNNDDWLSGCGYVDFMRDIGVHFNINSMLATEAYKNRLKEGGLTFLEMGYMLMQAYDFIHLNRTYGCTLQIGGSDQWANIVAGTMLNRKLKFIDSEAEPGEQDIFGLTSPLLLTRDGKKMGKTEQGTLWVARDRTAPYDFYQYFYNVSDEDVDMLLRLFTRVPLDQIRELIAGDIIGAKRRMAYEITRLVHGETEAERVMETAGALFYAGAAGEDAPTAVLPAAALEAGLNIIDLLAATGFTATKSDARRLVQQGGLRLNGEKADSIQRTVGTGDLRQGAILLKKGKKTYLKVKFE